MKCEYCGGNLSLEAERCPHCGQINKHAQQHIKDMNYYQGEFESTRQGVYSVTKRYTGVVVRVIVIAVLVVIIGILLLVTENSYAIRRALLQSDARLHEKEYSEILDQYLAEEDFRGFYEFCNEKGIDYYFEDGEYDQYAPLKNTVSNYLSFCEDMMDIAANKEDEWRVGSLCDNLNYFYHFYNNDYSYYDNADREENRIALEQMERNIKMLLKTYCHLTEEEMEDFRELSDAKRTVLIEEKLEYDE